jgi:hypothetical protein
VRTIGLRQVYKEAAGRPQDKAIIRRKRDSCSDGSFCRSKLAELRVDASQVEPRNSSSRIMIKRPLQRGHDAVTI